MPSRSLPERPSLEQLKNQAKDLLKAYRAGRASALVRFRESLPRRAEASDDDLTRLAPSLRDAQHVLAVEYGFSNWSHMRKHIQERENVPMLEMTVENVAVNPNSQQRVVVLRGKEASKYLPIWVGSAEGDAIALKLQGKEMPRPMTHDLMDSMISDLGAEVTQVVVNALEGDMFLGKVVLQRNDAIIERDSRPSDAIALALRTGAPIYAEEDVLDRAGVSFDPETGVPTSTNVDWPVDSIKKLDNTFSEEAKSLLRQAGARARRLGRPEIRPDDILLALIDEPKGAGARVLAHLGLNLAETRSKLEEHAGPREPASGEAPDLGEASRRVLRLARTEAYMFFRGQAGTEHILLGLILADDGLVSRILKEGEIEIETARAAVTKMLRGDEA